MSGAPTVSSHGTWHPYERGDAAFADLATGVHVWRVGLDGADDRLGGTLSDEERSRADRFGRPDLRRRFMTARGALRAILADCLGAGAAAEAHRLVLSAGPSGKPFLVDDPTLRFNVAHSEDVGLIAVTRAGEVGIDIERQRSMDDMAAVARLVFDEKENAAIRGGSPAAREAVFYRIWTRKEALLKAMGLGIAALEDPGTPPLSLARRAWRISTIPDIDGFVAALARPRATLGVRLWSWPGPIDAAEAGSQGPRSAAAAGR